MSSELISINYHLNRLIADSRKNPLGWRVHYHKDQKYYEAHEDNIDALVVIKYMIRNKYESFSPAMFKLTKSEGCVFITYTINCPDIDPNTSVLYSDKTPELIYDKKAGIDLTDKAFSTATHWKPDCPDPENCNKCGVCIGCGSEKHVNVQLPSGKFMCEECWT